MAYEILEINYPIIFGILSSLRSFCSHTMSILGITVKYCSSCSFLQMLSNPELCRYSRDTLKELTILSFLGTLHAQMAELWGVSQFGMERQFYLCFICVLVAEWLAFGTASLTVRVRSCGREVYKRLDSSARTPGSEPSIIGGLVYRESHPWAL